MCLAFGGVFMLKKILLIGAFLVPVIYCADGASSSDLEITTPTRVVVKRSWSLNPLNLLWWAIGKNTQTADNAERATARSLQTAVLAEAAADSVRTAAGTITDVSDRLQSSGVLLSQFERINRELGALQTRLAIETAAKEDAERRLQRLLSQPTPSSAVDMANAERDARTRRLEESVAVLSLELQRIRTDQSAQERQLKTFKENLAAIVDPEENDINRLLTKTAEKMATLSEENQRLAKTYRDAITALEKEIEERQSLILAHESSIASLNGQLAALRTATRRFEGNGYTALFDIITALGATPTRTAIAKAEQEIIAHVTHVRLLAPSVPFSALMQLDGQEMWIDRLLRFCKDYRYSSYDYNHKENKGRFFGDSLSDLFMDKPGHKFVKSGGTPINYNNPNLDRALRDGKLILVK